MKKIIIVLLLASISLMAMDGAKLYKQRCAVCHGDKGQKITRTGVTPLAGRDATVLALTIRAFRDQDERIGTYTMHKSSQIMEDSTSGVTTEMIVAIAKYISGLK